MHEKVINFQKWPKWRFWWLTTFLAFSKIVNTEQNSICVFIVFKAEPDPKYLGFFFKNQKCAFSGVKIK